MALSRILARRALGLAAAGALTVLLAQHTTSAAFTAPTSATGNSVAAATSFCASPTTNLTVPVAADTAVYQSNPNTNYGSAAVIGVGSASGANAYAYVKFSLPPLPARCNVTSAELRIYAGTPMAGATIYAYRAASAWNATTLKWSTGYPAFTGTPASTTSLTGAGWQKWDVTTQTQLLYAGPDYGFLLKDSVDNAPSARYQTWDSRESTTVAQRPYLLLSWG